MLGQVSEGMALIREGTAAHQSGAKGCYLSQALCALAEAQAMAGQPGQGLLTLDEALAFVEQSDERCWEAELHRAQAELLLMQGGTQPAGFRSQAEAETSLHKAIDVARRQKARSWELRATTSLARLWQAHGRIRDEMLPRFTAGSPKALTHRIIRGQHCS
jgi:adenylate cyclase